MKEDKKKGWKKLFSIGIYGFNDINDNDNWNLSGKLRKKTRLFFLSFFNLTAQFQRYLKCISFMVCVRFLCTQSEYILLVFCVVNAIFLCTKANQSIEKAIENVWILHGNTVTRL